MNWLIQAAAWCARTAWRGIVLYAKAIASIFLWLWQLGEAGMKTQRSATIPTVDTQRVMACVFTQLLPIYLGASPEMRAAMLDMVKVFKLPKGEVEQYEREAALDTLCEMLFPSEAAGVEV